MTDEKLMQYFKFSEADLEANRYGRFSKEQEKKLYGRQSGANKEKRIAVAIAFPLSLIMLGWMGYLISQNTGGGNVIILGCFGSLFFVASIYIFRLSLIRQKYLLKKVEGPINIIKGQKIINDHASIYYELHVGGKTFHASSALGDIMMQGDTYAIYYSEGSFSNLAEIQSAELISKAGA